MVTIKKSLYIRNLTPGYIKNLTPASSVRNPVLPKSPQLFARRLHTESGYGLRSGLWPTAAFTQAPLPVFG